MLQASPIAKTCPVISRGRTARPSHNEPDPDSFYEQKLVREQVAQLTGRRFLDGYSSDEAQYRALIDNGVTLSLIHISEPTRLGMISYAVFCLKKKNKTG
uniref:Uncharacterized protein n=1 Tax=Ralstonia solanacearum TaxID=305 RepID=A0A0S4WN04_RALSL|nr:protein of unknown function [Ralstonia solanacearum]